MSKATVQLPAPDFSGTAVQDGEFREIKLADYKGKWVVLFFYPMDFTFVCPTEILAFNTSVSTFEALNTALIACSTDSEYSHLAWSNVPKREGGIGPDLKLALLSDKSHKISRDYGVLLDEGVSLRGLFLIDPKGVLRQITINDLPVGRSVDETIRLVKAFQFVDVHGEVCPANWDPDVNSATMKADPRKSKDYFAQQEGKIAATGGAPKKDRPNGIGKELDGDHPDGVPVGADGGPKRIPIH